MALKREYSDRKNKTCDISRRKPLIRRNWRAWKKKADANDARGEVVGIELDAITGTIRRLMTLPMIYMLYIEPF